MKLITLENLTKFWTNAKSYIDTGLGGKADTEHTHSEYALTTDVPTFETATETEIDSLFN